MAKTPANIRPVARSGPFVRMLVADEFRVEQGGKVFAIGLYADSVVVLKIPENAPQPTKDSPFGLDSLSLLITVGGFEGDVPVRLTMGENPPSERVVSLIGGQSANLHVMLKPFVLTSFGKKTVTIDMLGQKHQLEFEVRADLVPPVDDMTPYLTLHGPVGSGKTPSRSKRSAPRKKSKT